MLTNKEAAKTQPKSPGVKFLSVTPLSWIQVLLILVAASAWPLQIVTANLVGLVHPERVALIVLVGWVIGISVALVAMRCQIGPWTSMLMAVVFITAVTRGGLLVPRVGPVIAWLAVGSLTIALGVVLTRLKRERLSMGLGMVLIVFMATGPVMAFVQAYPHLGEDVTRDTKIGASPFLSTPDVYLVVVDGYAGLRTFATDFDEPQPEWSTALLQRGFQIPSNVMASYPTTAASVPSLLDMSYVLAAGPGIALRTLAALHRMVGGDNNLVRIMHQNGYEVTMIETGWSGSGCGEQIDSCIASPFLDESTFLALGPTMFGDQIRESHGSPFTTGALATMEWLEANAEDLAGNGEPDLVWAHVTAPHPPFYLDASCNVVYDEARENFSGIGREGAAVYLEQARCVDSFMARLADDLPRDAVVVFVADHGSDTRNQLNTLPETWGEEGLLERMNPLLAVRAEGCDIGDNIVLPNLMRRVVSCFSSEPIPDLPPQMFVYASLSRAGRPIPITEVPQSLVRELLDH